MTWDWAYALSILPSLLAGLGTTVKATMGGIVIALPLGLIIAVLRSRRIPVVAQLCTLFVHFIRGTPLLVQAFTAYFLLPSAGLTLDPLQTGIAVIGINYSAYTAEVYRAGIEDVPVGQWEACAALSLPGRATWFRIILPQAVRSVIPALGNYWIQMFKDVAILSTITMSELLHTAETFGTSDFKYLEPLTLAGVLYFLVSYPAAVLIRRMERRFVFTRTRR